MPKYYSKVRPGAPNTPGIHTNSPVRPLGIPPILPVQQPEGYTDAPYPGDLTAGDGADRSFRPAAKPSGYSTNVPQPDNKGPMSNASGDGKNGMAG